MGLDNMVIIKSEKSINFPKELEMNFGVTKQNKEYGYELCYLRKCWGLRNRILYNTSIQGNDDVCAYLLDKENLKDIWKEISYFNNKKIWQRQSDSIWSYWEIQKSLDLYLLRLEWLIDNFDNLTNSKIYFYDSY